MQVIRKGDILKLYKTIHLSMNTLTRYLKPALLVVALFGFFAVANGAFAQATENAKNIYSDSALATAGQDTGDTSGNKVIAQVYNIIRFAYIFFYAIAVLLIAQAWLQFKQQKYDVMFASMGAALGLFLTPALIDFIHALGKKTAT